MQRTFAPLLALAALCGALSLGACNTVRGAGQDVQAAGNAVENAATDTQQDIQNHNNDGH